MSLTSFRNTITQLRQPAPYYPIATELKGAANIIAGTLQLISSQIMKLSSDPEYRESISKRHIVIGSKALKQGVSEFLPGAIVFSAAILMYKNWTLIDSKNTEL